jgi:hypothetical protein
MCVHITGFLHNWREWNLSLLNSATTCIWSCMNHASLGSGATLIWGRRGRGVRDHASHMIDFIYLFSGGLFDNEGA